MILQRWMLFLGDGKWKSKQGMYSKLELQKKQNTGFYFGSL